MMGDTYSAVKENSDKEWKFYRYGLVVDYVSSSPYPPPINLVFGTLFYLQGKLVRNDAAQLQPLLLRTGTS